MKKNGRNAGLCGCSSMAEQKLPKLHTSAENRHPERKTSAEIALAIQSDGIRAQNKSQSFPPTSCNAWEDCKHDGVCHDPVNCGGIGPNARCPYCDNTGDVHRADGEWLGSCDCGAVPS